MNINIPINSCYECKHFDKTSLCMALPPPTSISNPTIIPDSCPYINCTKTLIINTIGTGIPISTITLEIMIQENHPAALAYRELMIKLDKFNSVSLYGDHWLDLERNDPLLIRLIQEHNNYLDGLTTIKIPKLVDYIIQGDDCGEYVEEQHRLWGLRS